MRIAYFDCFAGLSGGMLLGALLGAGLPLDGLRASLGRLPLSGYTLDVQSVIRKGLPGTYLTVVPQVRSRNGRLKNGAGYGGVTGRRNGSNGYGRNDGYRDEECCSPNHIIGKSDLPDVVKRTSLAIFQRLARARAVTSPGRDAGAGRSEEVDTILTVVGVVAGLSLLNIDRVECSPLHLGCGVAQTSTGMEPTLSPVTVEMLRAGGVPVYGSHICAETVTPVGAAIISTVTSAFGPVPALKICSVGYGAGKNDYEETPNVVRLLVGSTNEQVAVQTGGSRVLDEEGTGEGRELALPVVRTEGALNGGQARPFVATREEWAALSIQGHQQNGRQRVVS